MISLMRVRGFREADSSERKVDRLVQIARGKDHSQRHSHSEVCEIDVLLRSRFTIRESIRNAVEQTSKCWNSQAYAQDPTGHHHGESNPPHHKESRHRTATQSAKKKHEVCLNDIQGDHKEDDGGAEAFCGSGR